MTPVLLAGALLGLAGSLHCAAMCGPLATLMRQRTIAHHTGRIVVYALLGWIAGVTGTLVVGSDHSRVLSTLVGTGLIATVILPLVWRVRRSPTAPFSRLVATTIAALVAHRRGPLGALAFGALNGLLPCGLLYTAVVAAGTLGPLDGVVLMLGFGAATLPALGSVVWLAGRLPRRPANIRRIGSAVTLVVGALLIVRGVWAGHEHQTVPVTSSHTHAR